jgi:hypothetical protein
MRPEEPRASLTCTRCGVTLEICAFCEREDCPGDAICYRCLRNQLLQSRTPSVYRP